jgi:hypothetical protein
MPRLKIFNSLERAAFESPPVFNGSERKRFFSLPLLLKESLVNLRTPTNQVCFLVAAGYFKARRKFFPRQFHPNDIAHVARQIGVDPVEIRVDAYSKESCARHRDLEPFRLRPVRQSRDRLRRGRDRDLGTGPVPAQAGTPRNYPDTDTQEDRDSQLQYPGRPNKLRVPPALPGWQ